MIKVYNPSVSMEKPVAILENAFGINYEKRLNEIWTAEFSLPANDPKNEECKARRLIEVFDGKDRVDLFRIQPNNFNKSSGAKTITYQCEHVLATLLDDLMFQYKQRTGFTIEQNLAFVLSYQSSAKWTVGSVMFNSQNDYKWENENLLSAVFQIAKAISGDYQWTWNTEVFPWILNLVSPSKAPESEVRYKKNLAGITKQEDPSYIITRLYPLGYGEGVNQLDITSVNGGIPYLEAETIGEFGVIAAPYIAKEIESAQTLKDNAKAYLDTVKTPRVTYTVDCADIYSITKDRIDWIRDVGAAIRIIDDDLGKINARVVRVSKQDLTGAPGQMQIEISNKLLDIADQAVNLMSRQYVNEAYAQGATNIDSNDYQDNCDNAHPATIEFYIPNETVRVNKCLLTYRTDKFRAYETAAASGGGSITSSQYSAAQNTEIAISTPTKYTGVSGGTTHAHSYSIDHSHQIPLAQHVHNVYTLNHTHDLLYGIYEFENPPPSLVIKVDGTTIDKTALTGTDIDIVPYLASSGGIVDRGTFHKVEIFPSTNAENPKGLARITASVTKMIFIQSRGTYTV